MYSHVQPSYSNEYYIANHCNETQYVPSILNMDELVFWVEDIQEQKHHESSRKDRMATRISILMSTVIDHDLILRHVRSRIMITYLRHIHYPHAGTEEDKVIESSSPWTPIENHQKYYKVKRTSSYKRENYEKLENPGCIVFLKPEN